MRRGAAHAVCVLALGWSVAGAQEPDSIPEQLLGLKRVYVDKFGGSANAAQLRDMIIASLQRARLFIITENPDKADAVLRGSAEDLIYTDVFQSGESIGARANMSVGRGSSTRNRDYASLGAGVNESENSRTQERRHEASASVRVVNREGDVIWSTTQESQGAKFRSASADVADKVSRQLVEDMEKLRARRSGAAPAAVPSPAPATP